MKDGLSDFVNVHLQNNGQDFFIPINGVSNGFVGFRIEIREPGMMHDTRPYRNNASARLGLGLYTMVANILPGNQTILNLISGSLQL